MYVVDDVVALGRGGGKGRVGWGGEVRGVGGGMEGFGGRGVWRLCLGGVAGKGEGGEK